MSRHPVTPADRRFLRRLPMTLLFQKVTEAAALYFAAVGIGEDFYYSRFGEAISSAGGEYAHAILGVEDGRIAIDHDEIAVAGTFTWGGTVESLP